MTNDSQSSLKINFKEEDIDLDEEESEDKMLLSKTIAF